MINKYNIYIHIYFTYYTCIRTLCIVVWLFFVVCLGGHRRGHTYIFKQSQHVLDFPKIVINSHDQGVVSFLEYDMDMGNL